MGADKKAPREGNLWNKRYAQGAPSADTPINTTAQKMLSMTSVLVHLPMLGVQLAPA